jgi:hypothetical protein
VEPGDDLRRARSGGATTLFLVEPPMDSFNVAPAHATVARSVHCRKRIFIIRTPHDVAEPFGAFTERALIFCH